jgi:hypothetical protein
MSTSATDMLSSVDDHPAGTPDEIDKHIDSLVQRIGDKKRKSDEAAVTKDGDSDEDSKKIKMVRLRRAFKNEQFFDEVVIKTVPRFRDGAGRDWRYSALLQVKRKGIIIDAEESNHVEELINYLVDYEPRMTVYGKTHMESRCDQEGCAEPFINTFRLKQIYEDVAAVDTEYVRCFCARHSDRGDDLLEDCNDNYVLIDGPGTMERNPQDTGQRVALNVFTERPIDPNRPYNYHDDEDTESE